MSHFLKFDSSRHFGSAERAPPRSCQRPSASAVSSSTCCSRRQGVVACVCHRLADLYAAASAGDAAHVSIPSELSSACWFEFAALPPDCLSLPATRVAAATAIFPPPSRWHGDATSQFAAPAVSAAGISECVSWHPSDALPQTVRFSTTPSVRPWVLSLEYCFTSCMSVSDA